MKSTFKQIIRVYDKCQQRLVSILSILTLVMVLLISIQVFSRYFLSKPVLWTTDLSNCILVALGFLGAGWLLKEDSHVSIDLVYSLLGKRSQIVIDLLMSTLGLITCFTITVIGYQVTYHQYLRGVKILTGGADIPKFLILGIIPIGMTFLSIEFVRKIRKRFYELRENVVDVDTH